MRYLVLAALVAATPLHADGQDTPAPPPQVESIERTTMGGSFPVQTVVTMIVLGIIAAAIESD